MNCDWRAVEERMMMIKDKVGGGGRIMDRYEMHLGLKGEAVGSLLQIYLEMCLEHLQMFLHRQMQL